MVKADAVLANPIAGILIFAGVMFPVFQISQARVGPWRAATNSWSTGSGSVGAGLVPGLIAVAAMAAPAPPAAAAGEASKEHFESCSAKC